MPTLLDRRGLNPSAHDHRQPPDARGRRDGHLGADHRRGVRHDPAGSRGSRRPQRRPRRCPRPDVARRRGPDHRRRAGFPARRASRFRAATPASPTLRWSRPIRRRRRARRPEPSAPGRSADGRRGGLGAAPGSDAVRAGGERRRPVRVLHVRDGTAARTPSRRSTPRSSGSRRATASRRRSSRSRRTRCSSDLGTKAEGIVPLGELSEENLETAKGHFNVGDKDQRHRHPPGGRGGQSDRLEESARTSRSSGTASRRRSTARR